MSLLELGEDGVGLGDIVGSGLLPVTRWSASDDEAGLLVFKPVELVFTFLTILPDENPAGSPPMLRGFAGPPIGGDRIRPPILTSCFDVGGLFRASAFLCLALLISAIHAGWLDGGGAALGLGESGLFRALSSQLDFVGDLVGLHLPLSPSFGGLAGGVVSIWSSLGGSSLRSLESEDICDREAGSAGFINPSFLPEFMREFFAEPDVPGRSFS